MLRTSTFNRTTRTCAVLCLLMGLYPGVALAQEALPQPGAPGPTQPAPAGGTLTVEEAVALAVRHNPRLLAAARDVLAARLGLRSARVLTNPSLLFVPSIIGEGSDEELLLQQPLELNGTRSARTGVAQAQLRQTQAQAVVELRDLVFQTRNAYYELARAQELRGVAQDVMRTAEEFDRITRRLTEEGLRPGIDRVQTEIEVTRARQQVTQAESRVATATAALNTMMGRSAMEPVGDLPPLPATFTAVGAEGALQQALAARAEIEVNEALRQQFLQEARLARAQGRPDLVPQFRVGSVTDGFEDAGIGLGVSLPLLDYGSRRDRVQQAEESARAQAARTAATRNQVRQEVQQAIARVRAAEATIQGYQQGVLDQARRLLEATRTGFQAGLYSIVQVLEAQRTYRAVLSEYTNALADYAQARAELERATGAVPATLLPPAARREGQTAR
jgi:outer membrane protein, heavy metal efflux system